MRDWTKEEAFDVVCNVIKEELDESILNDEECEILTAKILAALDPED